MSKNLEYIKNNRVATITFIRESALNALNRETLQELDILVDKINADKEITVVVITGRGRAFVAGADIKEFQGLSVDEGRELGKRGSGLFRKIELSDKIFIAAINGFALGGGCELAMSCDIRIASNKAKLGQPEINLGLIPGFGGTQRLIRYIGLERAKELILTGRTIEAEEANNIGLISKVVNADKLIEVSMKLADKIASKSRETIKYTKRAMNSYLENSDCYLSRELDIFGMCFDTPGQTEGCSAFIEKRKPVFYKEG
ncbi:enoyl-CoA hydratase-related protein (plasmid) [Fusobacteria bacterium ZRK30]|nr:enoyl-CoA hydratase-related protein [Fusobacteria bacterium ZRK30]